MFDQSDGDMFGLGDQAFGIGNSPATGMAMGVFGEGIEGADFLDGTEVVIPPLPGQERHLSEASSVSSFGGLADENYAALRATVQRMRKQASTDTDEDILSELLNLQEPRLTHEMMGYLRGPGVMKVFVGFISRYSAPSSTVPASETGGRDWENEEAMRKSYNAMNLLVPKMSDTMNPPQFEALCQRLLPELVETLLNIFRPGSQGYFLHFERVFAYFTEMDPLVVINALTETDIMDHLLNHIGQPGVLRSLMAVAQVLKTQASEWDENMEQSAIGFYQLLHDNGLLHAIFKQLVNEEYPLTHLKNFGWSACSVLATVGAMQQDPFPMLEELVFGFREEVRPAFGGLLAVICDTEMAEDRRKVLVGVARTYIENRFGNGSTGFPEGAKISKTARRRAERHYEEMGDFLVQYIAPLCETLDHMSRAANLPGGIETAGHTVKNAFGTLRLETLNVLHTILSFRIEPEFSQKCLEQFPDRMCRLLMQLLFNYPNNTMYHTVYYKIMAIVFAQTDEGILKKFLGKTKLVSKLISHLRDEGVAYQGTLLLLCNILRLQAEANPTGYLNNMLKFHHLWLETLPFILTESKRVFGQRLCVKGMGRLGETAARPQLTQQQMAMGVTPSGPIPHTLLHWGPSTAMTLATGRRPMRAQVTDVDDLEGVDSLFARHLGVYPRASEVDSDSSDVKSIGSSAPTEALAAEAGPVGGSGGKKKKKKKKKKSSAQGSADSTETEDSSA